MVYTNDQLDRMLNSKRWEDRVKAANQGYGLDKLVHDVDWQVRAAVAEQGYGLDILIEDADFDVKRVAEEKLKSNKGLKLKKFLNKVKSYFVK